IVIVSKPPNPAVASRVIEAAGRSDKPVVIAFLGTQRLEAGSSHITMVETLEEAAITAVSLLEPTTDNPQPTTATIDYQPATINPQPSTGYLRGLFSGGTFCYEAMLILQKHLGPIFSNAPLSPDKKVTLRNPTAKIGHRHVCLDLGAD